MLKLMPVWKGFSKCIISSKKYLFSQFRFDWVLINREKIRYTVFPTV